MLLDFPLLRNKSAIITGVTGQDGSYLAELLLNLGYKVHGIKRRTSLIATDRIDHLLNNDNFFLHYGELTDPISWVRLIDKIKPDSIYNLAAQSHVAVSFETPEFTADANALGPQRILEAIRVTDQNIKFYQASSSELFGRVLETPQNEQTPFYPLSPYAVAKQYAYWITKSYRESYGLHACNGILFNHESPRRGETFVTQKIARFVARMQSSTSEILQLGNMTALRDWGHAADYVRGMYLILNHDIPDDFVLATGTQYSVAEFCEVALAVIGKKVDWVDDGDIRYAYGIVDGQKRIQSNPKYYRPNDVQSLLGDSSKAQQILGWRSEYTFERLVEDMVVAQINEHSRYSK